VLTPLSLISSRPPSIKCQALESERDQQAQRAQQALAQVDKLEKNEKVFLCHVYAT